MRFSVITPCHNSGRWIQQTLRSAAEQSHPPHEIIVIDDGSTDDTVEKIEASGVDVKLLRVNCRNAAAARNAGIEVATGEWIAVLDSHDLWHRDHLRHAAQTLEGGEDVAYISTGQSLEGDRVRPADRGRRFPRERERGIEGARYLECMLRGPMYCNQTVVMRRDRVLEVGGYDVEQVRRHDIDLWLRVLAGRSWAYHKGPNATFRVDESHGLSRNAPVCSWYTLRALLKNRQRYAGRRMERLIRYYSRVAVGLACLEEDGRETAVRDAMELAWPNLPGWERAVGRAVMSVPGAMGAAVRLWQARKLVFR